MALRSREASVSQPLRAYTESGVVVTLVEGFHYSWNHIQILRELQAHIESATVKVRDEHGIEWHVSVGMLNLDAQLLRMLNPSAA